MSVNTKLKTSSNNPARRATYAQRMHFESFRLLWLILRPLLQIGYVMIIVKISSVLLGSRFRRKQTEKFEWMLVLIEYIPNIYLVTTRFVYAPRRKMTILLLALKV